MLDNTENQVIHKFSMTKTLDALNVAKDATYKRKVTTSLLLPTMLPESYCNRGSYTSYVLIFLILTTTLAPLRLLLGRANKDKAWHGKVWRGKEVLVMAALHLAIHVLS